MIHPESTLLHLMECGEAHWSMYTVYILIVLVALTAFVGTALFLLSTILVTLRAAAEKAGDALAVLIRKALNPALRHPEISAVPTVPYVRRGRL
ncbi:MAG TPA: hypothetical protein VMI06_16670 [Terriglobia bacterium]|nr:hypothetical protein [Terriglobia bacterium]